MINSANISSYTSHVTAAPTAQEQLKLIPNKIYLCYAVLPFTKEKDKNSDASPIALSTTSLSLLNQPCLVLSSYLCSASPLPTRLF